MKKYEWCRIEDKKKLTEQDVRRISSPVGLPEIILPEHVSHLGIVSLIDTPKPKPTNVQKIIDLGVLIENDLATQLWDAVPIGSQEVIDAILADVAAAAAAQVAEEARKAAKAKAYIDNLPSWSQVSDTIDDISDLPGAKAFLQKLARVVYWDIKNTEE